VVCKNPCSLNIFFLVFSWTWIMSLSGSFSRRELLITSGILTNYISLY
jgi:hypothetical protein